MSKPSWKVVPSRKVVPSWGVIALVWGFACIGFFLPAMAGGAFDRDPFYLSVREVKLQEKKKRPVPSRKVVPFKLVAQKKPVIKKRVISKKKVVIPKVVVGIIDCEEERQALVSVGRKTAVVGVGNVVEGYKVVAIGSDSVVVQRRGGGKESWFLC